MYHLHWGDGMFANWAYHWVMKCTNDSENSPTGRTGGSWEVARQRIYIYERAKEGNKELLNVNIVIWHAIFLIN